MAEISVLVPVCNVEKYLAKCLDSIMCQTFSDIEILCMDDGSTDNSGRILDQYAEKDSRLKVIHKKNSGYGHTMNLAVSLATGKYIGIVESDDYIEPDMYEKMYGVVLCEKLDFVKTDYYQTWEREDGTEQNDYHVLSLKDELYNRVIEPNHELKTYFMEKFIWNALYNKEFLIRNGICFNETPGASYQDNGFWFQTFYFAQRVLFLREAFYHYKQDNPNSSINSDKKIYAMNEEYNYIRNFLIRKKETNKILYKICFYFRIVGCLYTLSMLTDQYKQKLADLIKEECILYQKLEEAYFGWFSEWQLNNLRQICEDPKEYVDEQIRKNKKIRRKTEGYSCVVILGAGTYGRNVYKQIRRIVASSCMLYLAVTKLKGKKQYFNGCIVREIEEFLELRDTCLVILSVKYGTSVYELMMETLRNLQFKNIISYQEIL